MAEDIKKWIYSTLTDDSSLQSITGYSASDPRVYFRNDAPDDVNDTLTTSNCYLTFFLITDTPLGEDTAWAVEIPDLTYQIDIYGTKPSVIESAFVRVDILLNNIINPSVDNYLVQAIHRVGQRDDYSTDDRIHIKNLEYKFFNIYEKSS